MPTRMWPPTFPQIVLQNNYTEALGSQLMRSQPTAGPAIVRRKAGRRPNIISATVVFRTYEQYQEFERWVEDVPEGLAGGLYVFQFRHPASQQYINVRIIPQSDTELFTARPWDPGHVWEVTLGLEVLS